MSEYTERLPRSDAGSRRGPIKLSSRLRRKQLNDLRRTEEAVKKAERAALRPKGKSLKQRREEEREAQLEAAVPLRVCPECGRKCDSSRQWVVYGKKLAMCLKCWRNK